MLFLCFDCSPFRLLSAVAPIVYTALYFAGLCGEDGLRFEEDFAYPLL
jgi:hypothetical protein